MLFFTHFPLRPTSSFLHAGTGLLSPETVAPLLSAGDSSLCVHHAPCCRSLHEPWGFLVFGMTHFRLQCLCSGGERCVFVILLAFLISHRHTQTHRLSLFQVCVWPVVHL